MKKNPFRRSGVSSRPGVLSWPCWDDLRVLLEVHRGGSFLAAGQRLGLSTSTVARRIGALEDVLGRALVQRTAQGAALEGEAQDLVGLAERFEQALTARRRDGTGRSPYAGVVRVSLPDGFMAGAAEAAVRFRRLHPETCFELLSEARYVDLAAREADIGVRGARSSSPSLVEKPLGEIRSGLYASAAYLARRLPERRLRDGDYGAHDFLIEDAGPSGRGPGSWLMQRGAVRFPLRSNSIDARLQAAKGGQGLVVLAVGAEKDHKGLRRVELETPLPSLRFYITMHTELRRVPRIRDFAQVLHEVFAEYLAKQAAAEAAPRPRRAKARTRA